MEVVECVSVRAQPQYISSEAPQSGQTYVLKHISVPESQKQVDALMFTGAAATKEDAQKYYEQVVSDYQTELTTLETLSASPNLDCFRSYQIAPKEDGVGYDMYLLAEHRKTLVDYLSDNAMSEALRGQSGDGPLQRPHRSACGGAHSPRRQAVQHLLERTGAFPARRPWHRENRRSQILHDARACSAPTPAPELFSLLGTIEPTTDIYSVGLILYRIFNGNHAPFEGRKHVREGSGSPQSHRRGAPGSDVRGLRDFRNHSQGVCLPACRPLPEPAGTEGRTGRVHEAQPGRRHADCSPDRG